jgi:hypothetical protein
MRATARRNLHRLSPCHGIVGSDGIRRCTVRSTVTASAERLTHFGHAPNPNKIRAVQR